MYSSFNPSRPALAPTFGHRDPVAWLERRGINLPPDASARKVETYIRQHPQKFRPLITFIQSDEFKALFKREVRKINHVAQDDSAGRRLGLEVGLLRDPVTRHKKPVLKFWSMAGYSYGVNFLRTPRTEIMRQLRAVRVNAETDAGYIYAKTAARNQSIQKRIREQEERDARYLQASTTHPHPHRASRPERTSRAKRPLYFAYGSNLYWDQLKGRCPDAIPIRPAELKGWRVVYVGHSYNWKGAVASLKRTNNPNDIVKGCLFRLSESDKANLDRLEGLGRAYRHKEGLKDENGELRIKAFAQTATNGKKRPIFTYDRVALGEPETKPSKTYLKVIVEGLKYWSEKYPQFGWANYIQKMSQVKTNGQTVPEIERRLLGRIV